MTQATETGLRPRLKEVAVRPNFILSVTWNDGRRQDIDLSGLIAVSRHFKVFAKDPDSFAKVAPINWGHGIEWENGLDYSAQNLARIAEAQADWDGRALIGEFQDRYDLTNDHLATALGYSVSQVKNLKSGASPVNDATVVAVRTMMDEPAVLFGRLAGKRGKYVRGAKTVSEEDFARAAAGEVVTYSLGSRPPDRAGAVNLRITMHGIIAKASEALQPTGPAIQPAKKAAAKKRDPK